MTDNNVAAITITQFDVLNERLDRIECTQLDIVESMKRTETTVQKFIDALTPVLDEITPMLNNFMENSFIRMALRGKNK